MNGLNRRGRAWAHREAIEERLVLWCRSFGVSGLTPVRSQFTIFRNPADECALSNHGEAPLHDRRHAIDMGGHAVASRATVQIRARHDQGSG